MAWRDLAHSLFQRQQSIGTQRTTATQWWDEPLSAWPVGIHDFPDKQRPLFGGRGNAGGAGLTVPSVLLGSNTSTPCDLAVYAIGFQITEPADITAINPFGWFQGYAHIWTPQQNPDPIFFIPPTFPAINRGFLRPRQRVSDSGRAVILSGQSNPALGPNQGIQPEAQVAPRWANRSDPGEPVIFGSVVFAAPFPRHETIFFDPPLIVPGDQFVGVTALNPASNNGSGLVLDVHFVWREVSP